MNFIKSNRINFIFICLCFFARFSLQNAQLLFDNFSRASLYPEKTKCMTYKSTIGTCVPLSQCDELKNSKNINLLRVSLCGISNFMPKVCCAAPSDNTAPNPYLFYKPDTPAPRNYSAESDKLSFAYPKNLPQNCGLVEKFENCGGFVAMPGEAPWSASIQYRKARSKVHLCGGALISSSLVITSYQCVRNDDSLNIDIESLSVHLGEHDIEKNSPDDSAEQFEVAEVIVHPNNNKNYRNDIVLLRLTKNVTFNEKINPICLPYDSQLIRSKSLIGKNVKVTGWGSFSENYQNSQVLLRDSLTILNQDFCKNAFENSLTITEEHLCAIPNEPSKESCQGDVGGPVAMFDSAKKRWYLVGVTSFDKRCVSRATPGVYTRISKQLAWINEHI